MKILKKLEIKIKRPSGQIEIVDVTGRDYMYDSIDCLARVKEATLNANLGTVIEMICTYAIDNIEQLMRAYNDIANEGYDGYVPEDRTYWEHQSGYRSNTIVEVIR